MAPGSGTAVRKTPESEVKGTPVARSVAVFERSAVEPSMAYASIAALNWTGTPAVTETRKENEQLLVSVVKQGSISPPVPKTIWPSTANQPPP